MGEQSICEYYSGKYVLVTGATGFMGKVLVEKLLRTCYDVKGIYILIRGKKGQSADERWKKITELPLYDLLRKTRPGALESKVTVIEGDVTSEGLGLSSENRQILQDKINIVFHVAASVRFDDPLQVAVQMNTLATKRLVDLACTMKNLEVFLYVSTTYCNSDLPEVKEIVYPQTVHWSDLVAVVEGADPEMLSILTRKYIAKKPNTYVFSKAMAEQIVNEAREKIPIVIFRPSIVISSWKEPVTGWIDNINGPVALLIGVGKGVLRVLLCDEDAKPDFMAVDVAIKAMIAGAWKKAQAREDQNEITVYNASSGSMNITNREFIAIGIEENAASPWSETVWYPAVSATKSPAFFKLQAFYKHFLVALIIDIIIKMTGHQFSLLKLQIKVHNAVTALGVFATKSWTFHNENFIQLNKDIVPKDREGFDYTFDYINVRQYFRDCLYGGKIYLVHDPPENLPLAKTRFRRLYWLDKFCVYSLRLALLVGAYNFFF